MTKVVSLKTRTRGSRRSAAEWRELIASFKHSGETRKQFCARHGIALSTFAWWQSRLRTQSSGMTSEPPVFVGNRPLPDVIDPRSGYVTRTPTRRTWFSRLAA
jgi:hypothetical protein